MSNANGRALVGMFVEVSAHVRARRHDAKVVLASVCERRTDKLARDAATSQPGRDLRMQEIDHSIARIVVDDLAVSFRKRDDEPSSLHVMPYVHVSHRSRDHVLDSPPFARSPITTRRTKTDITAE